MISGGKEISRRAGAIETGSAKGDSAMAAISSNFRDGIISAIEGPSMKNLFADLKKSANVRDDEMMKTLVSMIKENQMQAKKLAALTKNAKAQK